MVPRVQRISAPCSKSASGLGYMPAFAGRCGQWIALGRRAAAPVALICVIIHIVLTCSSWRYTATLLVLDMSPSMLLASVALLATAFREPSGGVDAASCQETQGTQSGLPPVEELAHPVQSITDAAARPAGPWRKLWRKVAQAAGSRTRAQPAANPNRASPEATGTVLRRQGQMSPMQAHSRTSMDSGTQSPSSGSAASRSIWRQRSRGNESNSRWQPSMTRITSGQHLAVVDDTSSSVATSVATSRQHSSRAGGRPPTKDHGCDMPLVPHMGHLAVDCIQHDATMPHAEEITEVLNSQHLLQFGALLGESSAELALSQAGSQAPRGAQGPEAGCLLGATDNEGHWAEGWEQVAQEACARRGMHYCAWRRYLRKGLFMYKSRTVFEGVTPQQLAAFYFDSSYKIAWDDSCTEMKAIPPPAYATLPSTSIPTSKHTQPGRIATQLSTPNLSPADDSTAIHTGLLPSALSMGGASGASTTADAPAPPRRSSTGGNSPNGSSSGGTDWQQASFARSAYMYARTRFPTPMAQREYVYARRVWAKADDGGCYVLSKIVQHPAPPPAGCRVVRVQDYVSGTVIRGSALGSGPGPSAEIITVYFEDSHVASGIMNLGVRKALWPMVQKMEAALRSHVTSAHGAALQVAASVALQQACLPPPGTHHGSGVAPLRRCASAAGSCRGSLDGTAGASSGGAAGDGAGLMHTLSLRLPRGQATGEAGEPRQSWAGTAGAGAAAPRRTAGAPAAVSAAGMLIRCRMLLCALLAALISPLLAFLAVARSAAASAWRPLSRAVRGGARGAGPRAAGPAGVPPAGGRPAGRVSSHPVDLLFSHNPTPDPAPARRWGRRIAARLALVAVRAVSLPLAHRMLSRSSSNAGGLHDPPSRSDSMSSSLGGATLVAQHGGRPGTTGTQASMRESTARVRNWLEPSTASSGYLLGQHTELMQHHAALQQLQERRRQQQQLAGSSGGAATGSNLSGGGGGGRSSGMSMRPSLGTVVVDGVMMGWERPQVVVQAPAPADAGGGAGKGGRRA